MPPAAARCSTASATELPGATDAVTAFWGPQWPREVLVVVAGTPDQFATLAGGGTDVAATTTADRIMFAPGAAAMNDAELRMVLRHELFHYAARADTAADAPIWLTEGVADFVGRPVSAAPLPASSRQLPTDAELAAAGPDRSAAYDRAWSFASFVADTYGVDGSAGAVCAGVRARPSRLRDRGPGCTRGRAARSARRMARHLMASR